TLEIHVTDSVNTGIGYYQIIVLNENDNYPVVSSAMVSVPEDAVVTSYVHQLEPADADGVTSFNYTISNGNIGNAFEIDPASGIIRLADTLDFETHNEYLLEINVSDGINSVLVTVTVNIIDLNDEIPVFVTADQSVDVEETTLVATDLFTFLATDADANTVLVYEIVSGNNDGYFTINQEAGILSLTEALDYETITTYDLVISVNDSLHTVYTNFTMNVIDINDEFPVTGDTVLSISEFTLAGTELYTIQATDADERTVFIYSIMSGNDQNVFGLNTQTGIISLLSEADYEMDTLYSLVIRVSDSINYDDCSIVFNIVDENEKPTLLASTFHIAENSAAGAFVGQLLFTDVDSGGVQSYNLINGNLNNAFTLDTTTGIITINDDEQFNYEVISSYLLTLTINDDYLGVLLYDTAAITILIDNVNEYPIISDTLFSVNERAAKETLVGVVSASDVDVEQTLSFSIASGDDESTFEISSQTGAISVNNSGTLLFHNIPVYYLTIVISDNGIPDYTDTAVVTINVIDVIEKDIITATNYISPNDDGKNDYCIVESRELYSNCNFMIFDVLGNEVLNQTGYNNDWNAKFEDRKLPEGTYFYIISCPDDNYQYKGTITVLR
ncbi:MAG: cadherin domain-containing protein, partial [Bacteroidia bacterium]|nr:cadherin domain-containing protein [Bacteroidia bacterium]